MGGCDNSSGPKRTAAQRVHDAAKQLFHAQGIHATGVEEVCRAAGTTKMSLYRTYPSKDALIETLLREECEEVGQETHQALIEVPVAERPMALVRMAAMRVRHQGGRICPIGQVIVEFPDPEHPVRQLADKQRRGFAQALEAVCADAGAADPAGLAAGLMLLFEGASASTPYLGPCLAAKTLEESAAALLAAALPPAICAAAE